MMGMEGFCSVVDGFNAFCNSIFNSFVPSFPFFVGVNTCISLKKSWG